MSFLKLPKVPKSLSTEVATKACSSLFDSYLDYKKTVETERTKRAALNAARDVYVAKIEAQRSILEKFVDHTFAERRMVLDHMFATLQQGIDNNDMQAMQIALAGINNVISTPALQQVNQLMSQFDDPSVKEIEF